MIKNNCITHIKITYIYSLLHNNFFHPQKTLLFHTYIIIITIIIHYGTINVVSRKNTDLRSKYDISVSPLAICILTFSLRFFLPQKKESRKAFQCTKVQYFSFYRSHINTYINTHMNMHTYVT